MKVNVHPLEHARRMRLGRTLRDEPFRWLTDADLAAWKPLIGNRRKPGEKEGDEWRFRFHFVIHNRPYVTAYWGKSFEDMARGGKHAASISIMDMARAGVPIFDKDGRPVTGEGISVSNNWEPMLARLTRILYPEFPVGYARDFPHDETPYMTLIKPGKGPFSDWLEGRGSVVRPGGGSPPSPPVPVAAKGMLW